MPQSAEYHRKSAFPIVRGKVTFRLRADPSRILLLLHPSNILTQAHVNQTFTALQLEQF